MKQLQNLELTEEDFDLLVDGLEALPNKDMAADLMSGLLEGIISDDNPEKAEFVMKREIERKKREAENKMKSESIKILQGKLLLMKRILRDENILKQVGGAINRR